MAHRVVFCFSPLALLYLSISYTTDGSSSSAINDLSYAYSCTYAPAPDAGTAGVTQGVHRAVLDWSTGVIAKLASGLHRPTATTTSPAGSGGKKSRNDQQPDQQQDATAPARAAAGVSSEGERHARNARRWLSDPRIWQAFVRSLEGAAAAAAADAAGAAGSRASEPNIHLPQSAGLGVLRAAVFAVRDAAAPVSSQDNATAAVAAADGNTTAAVASAADWAALAIRVLCGGGIAGRTALDGGDDNGGGGGGAIMHSGGYDQKTSMRADENGMVVVEEAGGGTGGRRERRREPLVRASLDAYVAFLEEVVREHGEVVRRQRMHRGTLTLSASRAEDALTELLRFQVALQGQQTNRRKVHCRSIPVCLSCLLFSVFFGCSAAAKLRTCSNRCVATFAVCTSTTQDGKHRGWCCSGTRCWMPCIWRPLYIVNKKWYIMWTLMTTFLTGGCHLNLREGSVYRHVSMIPKKLSSLIRTQKHHSFGLGEPTTQLWRSMRYCCCCCCCSRQPCAGVRLLLLQVNGLAV